MVSEFVGSSGNYCFFEVLRLRTPQPILVSMDTLRGPVLHGHDIFQDPGSILFNVLVSKGLVSLVYPRFLHTGYHAHPHEDSWLEQEVAHAVAAGGPLELRILRGLAGVVCRICVSGFSV